MERVLIISGLSLLTFALAGLYLHDSVMGPSHSGSLKRKAIEFQTPQKSPAIEFVSPRFFARHSFVDSETIEFNWRYRYSAAEHSGPFVFEISDVPTFKRIILREELEAPEYTASVQFPSDIYYRVKDSDGNFSKIHRLTLLKPKPPEIRSKASFVTITAPAFDSRARLEVAKDPQFKEVVQVRTGVDSKYRINLPTGKYFVRARMEYKQIDQNMWPIVSAWSSVIPF